jgi:hypothetical protein
MPETVVGRGLVEILPDFRMFGKEMASSMKLAAKQATSSLQPIEGAFRDSNGRLRAANGAFLNDYKNGWKAAVGTVVTSMAKVGKGVAVVGLGVAAISVKMAGDFQKETNVLVTAAGETEKGLKVVRAGIMNIATNTGTGMKDLTDGMYTVEKAGYRAKDGLMVLTAAAQGAREENANLAVVTNAMTSVMASYHLKATDSVRVMNALKTSAGEGKVTMEGFAGALSTVLPIASANKVSFEEVAGAIATLTQHGTSANEATQELASTIRQLAKPSDVARKEMARFGLSSQDVALNLGKRGLTGTIDLLTTTVLSKMGPSGKILMSAFNNTKQAGQALQDMMSHMPASLQVLAKSFLDGKIPADEWRKTIKGLPVDQKNLIMQFTSLVSKNRGFSEELRKGGPASKTFTEAIAKMSGGAIGLNTVLQLSGESATGFKERVEKTGKSFHNASKEVEGWKSTQGLFNVQMDRVKQTIDVLLVKIGTKLIPIIQTMASWMLKNKDAMEAIGIAAGVLATSLVALYIGTKIYAVYSALAAAAGWLWTTSMKAGRAAALGTRIELAALWIWQKAIAAYTAVVTAAQWAWNLAMEANPIGLIIIAVVALVAAIVIAYKNSETFRKIVQACWKGIQTAAIVVWETTLKPIFNALVIAFKVIGDVALWLWHNIYEPAFKAMGAVISFWFDGVKIYLKAVWIIFQMVGAIALWLWHQVMDPVFHTLVILFGWWWAGVKLYFGLVMDGFRAVGSAGMWLWHNAIEPLVHGIVVLFGWWWAGVKLYFGYVMTGFRAVGNIGMWVWHNLIEPAVHGIVDAFKWWWNGIRIAYDAVKSLILIGWEKGIKPVFNSLKWALGQVVDSFETGKKNIGKHWHELEAIAKAPISFMINTVYNKGIIGVWNAVADVVHGPHLNEVHPKGFAGGGILPGYSPGQDIHRFYSPTGGVLDMSGGETILRPEFTKTVGPGWVARMNRAAKSGGIRGVSKALGYQGFDSGGIFGGVIGAVKGVGGSILGGIKTAADLVTNPGKLWDSATGFIKKQIEAIGAGKWGAMIGRVPLALMGVLRKKALSLINIFGSSSGGPAAPGVAGALDWAKSQAGLPYQWAGAGDPSWDCSGFMSGISKAIIGQNPRGRLWSTFDFQGNSAPAGWAHNVPSPFQIGITNEGVGHTAGTLAGVNVESSGGAGVHYGPSARGAHNSLFHDVYGFLPARAMPFGGGLRGGVDTYDSGGWLPRGISTIYNGTRGPERIRNQEQEAALNSGKVIQVTIENHGVLGSQAEVEDWLIKSLGHLNQQGRLTTIVKRASGS